MNVRQARIEDSAALAQVQVDSYRTAYAGMFPQAYLDRFTVEEQEQDWSELLSLELEDVLLVAETEAGEVVGYALGRPGLTEIPLYESELVALHVSQSYQGQGIGRQLLVAVAGELKQKGCRTLMLWVLKETPSRLFYEGMGGQLLAATKESGGVIEVAYGWTAIERLCP